MLTGLLARRWCKSPKLLHMISLKAWLQLGSKTAVLAWLYPFPHCPLCTTWSTNTTLENKVRVLFTETWSPHVVLSLTFWLNSHLGRGGLSSLLILSGLLRSDRGGLSVSSPSGDRRMPAAYVGNVNSLPWNFISFPCKPSYSASFLHWIFLLSYPYSITLYIFN